MSIAPHSKLKLRHGHLWPTFFLKDGEGLPNAAHDQLLNLFFALESILTKELNALRLNDALWQGVWSAKNRFLTQLVKAPLMGSPSPAFVGNKLIEKMPGIWKMYLRCLAFCIVLTV
ncbi:hypothetical protein [Mitsuokella jalaludinii]|uniref:hypothetical protein n=1 Tax=Mitsuokella jalaludinii TaxID=187979 RepID=UPI000690A868|nr:hypothetical protein [Mitsuokella jalaludinii]MCQ1532772.1 hypothetical protein [Mitsuokella jalaludinii]